MTEFSNLVDEINACTICSGQLPLCPKPILQAQPSAKLLIAGQAPGIKAHNAGIPFDDPSGERLRDWLGLSRQQFYDSGLVALVPMGFCYPGTAASGDLPPRPECAARWRQPLLSQLENVQMTLVLGAHSQKYHFPNHKGTLTQLVQAWQQYWPTLVPLPHPSPRNNRWLRNNKWFEQDLLPCLKERVATVINK